MCSLKINEQITSFRKQKGVTQEELARALGVTNQAVSKWESGQCCPDIQLLPQLAGYFGVSVDMLLGCKESEQSLGKSQTDREECIWSKGSDIQGASDVLQGDCLADKLLGMMRKAMEYKSDAEAHKIALQLAYGIHGILWAREMERMGVLFL